MSKPYILVASQAPERPNPSVEPFKSKLIGRTHHALAAAFGIAQFVATLTRLAPGAWSDLHHSHSEVDELVYVLAGEPTLVWTEDEQTLSPGMTAGFPAGSVSHHLENRTEQEVALLEIAAGRPGDEVTFPQDRFRVLTDQKGIRQIIRLGGATPQSG